ncbi:MAG: GspH/FimT family pseudopilin [Proteobacteria bacterium]|nr:GspH/FimT family pseudopilin [Pseudomonadota bacterium]
MLRHCATRGFSLIEMMLALVIVALFVTLGVPAFAQFLQNTQIRNAAETTLAGINLARAEAIRRNAAVRFQLVSDLSNGCNVSAAALSWVVSLSDPSGACDAQPSETLAPLIVQKKSSLEGSKNAVVSTTGGASLVFNGLGRVSGAGITQLSFSNTSGTCEHLDAVNGTMRCLQIRVSTGGQTKMCDPKVVDTTDPRHTVERVLTLHADSPRYFEEPAQRAFRAARFSPGLKNGKPVKVQMTIEVTFDSPPPPAPPVRR